MAFYLSGAGGKLAKKCDGSSKTGQIWTKSHIYGFLIMDVT